MREHVHPSARCERLRRASVGNSQETWFFDAVWDGGSRELVLRRSAADGTLTWTDRTVEYEALAAVSAAGLPVPTVVWLDADGGALERPYFVMDRAAGSPPRDGAVSFELGELLARLHATPVTVELPGGDEVARWHERYLAVRLGSMPLLGALFAWLEANAPAPVSPVLLWGDAGPHNLLVEDGRITALLDWELAHVGHPLDDLGAAQWACFGVLDPDAILAGYESVAGPVDREALRWFRCLACVSRTVMLLASNRAWVEGTVHRPSLAALGLDLVARNLSQAAREAGWEAAAVTAGGGEAAATAGSGEAAVTAGDGEAPVAGDGEAAVTAGGGEAPVTAGSGEAPVTAGSGEAPVTAGGEAPDGGPAARISPRPDAGEVAAGLARFLAADLLPATEDRALRRELKNAVALLKTVALQTRGEHADQEPLEDEARRRELAHDPSLRARLLVDHARADEQLAPLRRLFTR